MPSNSFERYNLNWPRTAHPASIEMDMLRGGGQWKKKNGELAGNGLLYHFQKLVSMLWPHIVHHKWNELFFEKYLSYRTIGVLGPASSGKTNSAAIAALVDYYCYPSCTTVICCSTTRERLEDRIWGEIKKLHIQAKEVAPWLDGNMIESRMRIITDGKDEADGRDFRNGLVGVPCKKGESYVGLGDFAGLKNKRVRLFGDELSLLPRVFVDAISNLDKNTDFKGVGMGNPKDTTDALGVFCEPSAAIGGWDGGIDQTPETKCWETRRPMGICIQLPGTDSPNLDGKLGCPIITQEAIDRDVAFYGKDSLWFTMMNQGMMPRGQGSRRVITRQMCQKFGAMNDPLWRGTKLTQIGFLDAAYGGRGGDRCIFGRLQFGEEVPPDDGALHLSTLISQNNQNPNGRQVIHLIETMVVPISNQLQELPEDQIVTFVMNRCQESGIEPENFFFDSGMRASLVNAFARRWSPAVTGLDFGGRPTERRVSADIDVYCKDYYFNLVTELWFAVRHIIEAGQFRGMTEDVMAEGCQREWTIVGANKHQVEPKDKMKEKTGRSPDLFDALVCGIEGARRRGFVIKRLSPDRPQSVDQAWKKELRDRAKKLWTRSNLNYAA